MAVVSGAPVGTIALLFTDIEGSTRLASELDASWPGVLAEHHAIVGGAIAQEGGFVDRTEGDAFIATFVDARAAARAAVAALTGLRSHPWPSAVGELKVRMGLHVGFVERNETGYVGLEVHRAARVAAAAHGGQLLITGPARALVGDQVQTEPLGSTGSRISRRPSCCFALLLMVVARRSFRRRARSRSGLRRATAQARDLGPDALSAALMFEAQTRLAAGQPDLAAAVRDEADQIGADSIFPTHSFDGDLALVRGQPRAAAHEYALSLEFAQERRDQLQVFNDLTGIADALAMNGDDIEALEVSGIADAHINDMGGTARSWFHIQGQDPVLEAEKRLGADAAAQAKERGQGVDAGYRVTRACELARAIERAEL